MTSVESIARKPRRLAQLSLKSLKRASLYRLVDSSSWAKLSCSIQTRPIRSRAGHGMRSRGQYAKVEKKHQKLPVGNGTKPPTFPFTSMVAKFHRVGNPCLAVLRRSRAWKDQFILSITGTFAITISDTETEKTLCPPNSLLSVLI